jgi:DNA-binding CsgD family transcriptional regulator
MTQSRRVREPTGDGLSRREPAIGECRMALTETERAWLEGALSALTARERDVAFAVCEGGDHEQVAASLCIAVPTLRTHLMRIHQKLGAESKVDVVRYISARLLEFYRERDGSLAEAAASKPVVKNGLGARALA